MPSLQLLDTGFPLLQVQLSCYGDAIGGDLKALKSFLDNKLSGKYFKWFCHYNFCKCVYKQHLFLPVARMRNRQSTLLEYLQLCTIAMLEHLRFHPAGAISGLHLLPIYPSSGDGGFAPLTYQDVDPKFGTWDDVKALGAEYDLQMECMVNHISPASKEFQDYLSKGDKSEFRDMFIDWNKFWGGGFLLVSIC